MKDPVCGMNVQEDSAYSSEYHLQHYHFCSESCQKKFDASPADYAISDPVCGMTVTDESEYHVEHAGKTQYFCSDKCLTKFSASPEQYS